MTLPARLKVFPELLTMLCKVNVSKIPLLNRLLYVLHVRHQDR